MSRKLITALGAAALLSLVSMLIVSSAFAAATRTGGSATPADALQINGTTYTLPAGASAWYGFMYPGDLSQVSVMLSSGGMSGFTFQVFTPDEIANGLASVGAGSFNPFVNADLFWTGNFNTPGFYYVEVMNTTGNALPYSLMINGNISGLPETSGAESNTAIGGGPATTVAAAPAAAIAAPAGPVHDGSSVQNAFILNGTGETLAPGASAWYMFKSAGGDSENQVWLNANGASGMSFTVWTPEEIANGTTNVGAGSFDPFFSADLLWQGNFVDPGIYYVQVTNNSDMAVPYMLNVSGNVPF